MAYCRRCAAQSAAPCWGNKITTEQVYGLAEHNIANPADPVEVLPYFFERALAGIKIVFILRDGRTCVRSKMNRTGQSLDTACSRWRQSVDVLRYLRESHDNNVCVRFEDLLTDPQPALETITSFLGVAFEPGMLAGTQSRKMLPEYRSGGLDPSKTDLDGVPEGCVERIEHDLRYCGYL